jgi:hypothetical protein
MKKVTILDTFRFGGSLYYAGDYRVPQDISEEAAVRAVRDALGEWAPVAPKKAVPPAVASGGGKGGRKSAGGAPENKAQQGGAGGPVATFPATGSDQKLD